MGAVDFNEVIATVNLLEFILSEFKEYGIDTTKSDKTQTRLISADEEIDVYKGPNGWLYFNRTDPFKNNVKDEGNIIQFLKVRYHGNYQRIIKHLDNYQKSHHRDFDPQIAERQKDSQTKIEWLSLINPLTRLNGLYLSGRGIDLKLLTTIPNLNDQVISFSYTNKRKITTQITGFPLRNLKGEIEGVELRRPAYGTLDGKFSAPNSKKIRSFWTLAPFDSAHYGFVGESPIDIISYIQLHGFQENSIYIGTAGRFSQEKASDITKFMLDRGVQEVRLVSDNDVYGQTMNLSIASVVGSSDPNLPTYFKSNVNEDKQTIVFEISNIAEAHRNQIVSIEGIHLLTQGSKFLSFQSTYSQKLINDLLHVIQSNATRINLSIHKPNAKDWNQELQNNLKQKQREKFDI